MDISLVLLGVILILPSTRWIKKAFLGLYDPFNLILFLAILGLIIHRISTNNIPKFSLKYVFRPIPFTLALASLSLWVYFTYFFRIHIFAATFGFTFLFGIIGLYIPTKIWIKSIIPLGLLLMTLPFGNIIDVYLGFPLRMWTVNILENFFHDVGWNSVTSNTIITIDNTASQIDYSCSGLKGLWAGLIFYFTLSWMENLKLSWKWISGLVLLFFLLLAANVLRILSTISLTAHYHLDKIAKIVHAPLGIIGFTFACGLVFFYIKSSFFRKEVPAITLSFKPKSTTLSPLLWTRNLLFLIIIPAFFVPKAPPANLAQPFDIHYPTDWHTKPLNLTEEETQFFHNQGTSTQKFSFSTDSLLGSFLLVSSPNWKGHHNPELCIRAGGNDINQVETIQINPNFPIKWLQVNDDATACFWYQNPTSVTDDFGTRVWSELQKSQKRWVLVSIVFNKGSAPTDTATNQFLKQLNQLVHNYLNQ